MTTTTRTTVSLRTNRKHRKAGKRGILSASISALLGVMAVTNSADAATRTWDGLTGNPNWTAGGTTNWTGGVVPVANDSLQFSAAPISVVNNNDFAAGTAFNSITFLGGGSPVYSLNGNAITLGAGGITNLSNANNAINFGGTGVTLSAAQTWSATNGALNVASNVNAGGSLLSIDGTSGSTIGGVLSGNNVLAKAGSGNLTLFAANTFSGQYQVNAGTLTLNGSNANVNSVFVNNASSLVIGAAGSVTTSGSGVTVQGTSTISAAAATSTITGNLNYTSTTNSTFQGVIAGGASTVTVNMGAGTIAGTNQLTLSGTNTYGGATNVISGALLIASNGALSGSGVTVSSGASLRISGGVNAGAVPLSIVGGGQQTGGGTPVGALFGGSSGGTSGYAGAITLAGNARIGVFAGAGGVFNLTGGVNTNGNAVTFGFNNLNGATLGVINVNSVISGSGGAVVDAQTTNYNASNTYTGTTSIINGGILNAAAAGALPAPAADGGTGTVRSALIMDQSGTGSSRLNLVGFNQAVASLTGAATSTINLNSQTLTVGTAAGTTTFAGVISGNGGITKDGASTQILSGNNLYLGATTIQAGHLQIGNGTSGNLAGFSAVTVFPGAFLDLNLGDTQIFANSVNNGGTVAGINTSGNQFVAGPISGIGNFVQGLNGAVSTPGGTTTFTSNGNTYQGGSRITGAGSTLVIGTAASGSTAGSNAAANTIVVDNGGTLQLVNVVGGVMNNNITNGVGGLGTLVSTPGLAVTTTLTGTLTDGGAGTLSVIHNGFGTTVLANAGNTYTGATTVRNGTLQIGNTGGVGSVGAAATTINVTTGGTLAIVNIGTAANNTLANNINNGGGGTGTVNVNSANTNTLSGVLSNSAGTLNLVQSGTGTTILTGANSYSGTTTISGGTLQVGNGGTVGQLGTGAVTNNAILTVNRSNAVALTNNISGTGVLNQVGTGVTTLSGNNSYTGATNVQAGTLQLSGNTALGSSSAVTVTGGATLDLNGTSPAFASPLNLNGTGVGGNGVLTNTNAAASTFTGPVTLQSSSSIGSNAGNITLTNTVAGGVGVTLTKIGTDTLTFNAANTYNGATFVNAGVLVAGNSAALGDSAAGTTVASGATLGLTGNITIVSEPLTISGTGAAGQTGVLVNISGTNNYAGPITLAADSTISSDAGLLNITNPGAITGGGFGLTLAGASNGTVTSIINPTVTSLTKNGAGTWTLNGVNTYTGATTVNAGTLKAGVPVSAFGIGSAVNLTAAAATLDLNGNSNTIGSLTGVANSIVDNTGAAAVTLTTGSAGSTTFNGIIQNGGGALSLTKVGTGTTLTLATGANTYTGLTTVSEGILNIQNGASLGAVTAGTVVSSGATLQIQGGITVGAEALTLNGTGAAGQNGSLVNVSGTNNFGGLITLGSASTISSDAGLLNLTNTGTIVGGNNALTLTGAGNGSVTTKINTTVTSLTKNGAGTWTLNGANSYTGATTVNNGTLQAGTTTSAFGVGSAVNLTNATGVATLDLNGKNNTIGSLTGVAASFVDNTAAGVATLTTGSAGSTTYNGIIKNTGGALSLTKVGANTTFTLTNANTYTGLTTVSQGILNIRNNAGLGAVTAGTVVSSGATLQLQNSITVGAEALTLNGTGAAGQTGALVNVSGTNNFGGLITLGSASTISSDAGLLNITNGGTIVGGGNALTLAGAANGTVTTKINATTSSLTKTGAGTWTLIGANTYTGPTNVNGGTLKAGVASVANTSGAFGKNSAVILANTAGTILDITGFNTQIGSLAGGGAAGGNVTLGAAMLTTGDDNTSTTFSGVISGAGGSLVKNGSGTFIVAGTNTYTGGTTLNGTGTLAAANGSAFGNGSLTLNGGTFRTSGGPLVVNIGGGAVQFNAGIYLANVGGTTPGVNHDQLKTTGAANTLGGTLALVQQNGYLLAPGDKVNLLVAGSVAGGSVNGTPIPNSSITGLSAFSVTPLLVPTVNAYLTTITLEAMQGSFGALAPVLGFTPNQRAVAGALDSVAAKNLFKTGVVKELNYLDVQSLATLRDNLDKIAPEELTSIFHLGTALANVNSNNLTRRMDDIRSGNASAPSAPAGGDRFSSGPHGPVGRRSKEIAPPNDAKWGAFLTGSGEFTHIGGTANAAGYNLNTGGVTAGADYRVSDKLAVGLSLGYANTTASLANGGSLDADGGRLGLYATYFDRNFHVDASVTGGINSYKSRRVTPNNTVATGSPDGSEINVFIGAGYDWKFGAITVGPVASYQYTNMRMDGFTETGAFAPLAVSGQSVDSSRTSLGIRATYEGHIGSAVIRPEMRLAWQHEFGATSYAITSRFSTLGGNPFTVSGPAVGRDSLLASAGFIIMWNERLGTYLYYDGQIGAQNLESHNISGGVRYQF